MLVGLTSILACPSPLCSAALVQQLQGNAGGSARADSVNESARESVGGCPRLARPATAARSTTSPGTAQPSQLPSSCQVLAHMQCQLASPSKPFKATQSTTRCCCPSRCSARPGRTWAWNSRDRRRRSRCPAACSRRRPTLQSLHTWSVPGAPVPAAARVDPGTRSLRPCTACMHGLLCVLCLPSPAAPAAADDHSLARGGMLLTHRATLRLHTFRTVQPLEQRYKELLSIQARTSGSAIPALQAACSSSSSSSSCCGRRCHRSAACGIPDMLVATAARCSKHCLSMACVCAVPLAAAGHRDGERRAVRAAPGQVSAQPGAHRSVRQGKRIKS